MLKKYFLPLLLMLITVACLPQFATAQKKDDYKSMAADVLRYVNKHRAKMGLQPLVMKDALSKQAEEHSSNMATGKAAFSHDGMGDRLDRACKEMKENEAAGAENIAAGQSTAEGVVADWLTSKGHKANIEGSYTETGIGIAKDKYGQLYFTQLFLRPRSNRY